MQTMDFFGSQDAARRRTWLLVALFALAVVLITVVTHFIVGAATAAVLAAQQPEAGAGSAIGPRWWLDPVVMLVSFAFVLLVVGGGSFFKIMQLRGGGGVVAERLGGRRVHHDTTDPAERRLLNVVEEMAIASGVPTPPVYLLSGEQGINAFAAGHSPNHAVIGVTRGCVERLTRDELQGVIAHEYSHILNGDMRLNIRLMGWIHGIIVLSLIGRVIFELAARSGRGVRVRTRGGKGGGGQAVLAILAVGGALWLVGLLGSVFASIIKSAVSRQREFLADAAAVQFTRNPGGIAGALKRIGGLSRGSRLDSAVAEEASHLFFGQGIVSKLGALTATHPPLPTRIRRIEPSWDGSYPKEAPEPPAAPAAQPASKPAIPLPFPIPGVETGGAGAPGAAMGGLGGILVSAAVIDAVVASIGRPTPEHVEHAKALLARIPEQLRDAAHEPYGARALVYAMLLHTEPDVRTKQTDRLRAEADPQVVKETARHLPQVRDLPDDLRLPLVEVAVGALGELTPEQYERFHGNVEALISADGRIGVFEWCLHRLVFDTLDRHFGKRKSGAVQYYAFGRLGAQCSVLLSTLARLGSRSEEEARAAFALGAQRLAEQPVELLGGEESRLLALEEALRELSAVAPQMKRKLMEACVATTLADGKVTVREHELLRAVAACLECPMPPLLPGQSFA